ncbi:MAG: hypothetical protein JW837_07205 [Sedimentisphaerales bacterium]|nr:hypothetical protein [Sedimentisphaerales bacterium]
MRKFSLICITIVGLAGCSGTDNIEIKNANNTLRLDTGTAMTAYLRSKAPPALQSVEVWNNRYGPGLKLTTAHYEIFTTLLEPSVLAGISGFVESAYRAYNSQLPESIEIKTKFTVYLFANRRQWESFTRSFADEQAEMFCKIKAGAYYHNGVCVVYDIGIDRTLSALAHEGWHQFNGRCFKFRLPSWLDEGMAMLFETHGSNNGQFYFEPSENMYRLDGLRKTLANNKMIPLAELIEMNPGDVLATDQTKAVMAYYSQSYALVRFLQEAGYGRWRGTYRRLLLDGLTGHWQLDETNTRIALDRNIPKTVLWNRIVGRGLFEDYVSDDFERIEKEYLAFCRQIIYPFETNSLY